jgi:hypothetical protein
VQTTLADGAERAFHPKAWLFDSARAGDAFVGSSNLTRSALSRDSGRFQRLLFLAHRHELLAQAEASIASSPLRARRRTWAGCAGDLMQPDTLVVVASVQKLARPENLQRGCQRPTEIEPAETRTTFARFRSTPFARARRTAASVRR